MKPTQAPFPRFPLGQIVATPGALAALKRCYGEQPPTADWSRAVAALLFRHAAGDWGQVCAEDKQSNDHALKTGARLLSAYVLTDGTRVWLITEADRSATTILLPEDY